MSDLSEMTHRTLGIAANELKIPFYLGVSTSSSREAMELVPVSQQTTCQQQQPNGIWVTVTDD
jgi:hypothetical protein